MQMVLYGRYFIGFVALEPSAQNGSAEGDFRAVLWYNSALIQVPVRA